MYAPADPQMIGQQLVGLVLAGLVLVALYHRRRWKPDTAAHGTARWMTARERAAKLGRPGLVLGRDPAGGELLYQPKAGVHWLYVAPTAAGKGTGYIIPHLLTHPGSAFVIDPKGEAVALTATARRRLGKVYVLDPYRVTGETDCLNPLDLVDGLDESAAMADSLVVRQQHGESDPHWNDQAVNLLTGLIALVAAKCRDRERSLSGVCDVLAGGLDGAAKALAGMGGLYARYGALISTMGEKELGGVVSTATRHLAPVASSPAMDHVLSRSTFALAELIGDEPCTVYAVLPPEHLEARAGWLRVMVTGVIRTLSRSTSRQHLLMVIDEAGQLRYMPALTQGLSLMRSFGLRMHLYFQSLQQLQETFKGHESVVLDNTSKVFFGINSLESAKYVSEYMGAYTHVSSSYSVNTGTTRNTDQYGMQTGSTSTSDNLSVSTHQRSLMTPDELLTLPRLAAVCLIQGLPPLLVKRVEWWTEPFLKRLQKGG